MISSITLGLFLAAFAAVAQPAFEVTSVKPAAPIASKEGKERVGLTISGSRVEITYTSLAGLVQIAYRVKAYQVVGPGPTTSDHFDVQAKMPEGAGQDQLPEMLQTLLAERFKLTLHREQKEHAIYALLVGKNGPKLQETEPADGPATTGWTKSGNGMRLDRKMTLAALADLLGRFADRPVIDMTALKGTYQIDLEIPFDDLMRAKTAAEGAARGGSDSASDPADFPLFSATQKLGLKVEPRKTPVEVLVIDHADKLPTAN
uniref:Uncharacterized protein n=1 Tax=Solibacter usitatus (strain Ellin6076) TaxID=234267 RepID=Q02AY4_SOLUE